APVLIVGAPVQHAGALYNAAVVISRGRVLGVTPKSFLPNYREFYENRWFAPGAGVTGLTVSLAGQQAPLGADPALDPGGAGRRADPLQPLGIEYRGGQGRRARAALRLAVDALPGRLSLFGRGAGREHHRPCLGRPGLDPRARPADGPDRALPGQGPDGGRRHRRG